jgi:hypothetical protein
VFKVAKVSVAFGGELGVFESWMHEVSVRVWE